VGEDTDSVGWNTSVSSDVRRIHVDRRWGDEPNANRFTISVPFRRHYVVLNGLAPRAGKDFQLAGDLDCDDCSGWSVECSGCQVSVREARKEFRLSTDPVIPAKNAATIIKQGFCASIPSGRTLGVSGAIGGIGGQAGTLEMVTNYNTGEVSGFASGGVQVGFNGGASANVLLGLISNLGNSNANYSGPFTNAAASVGAFGAFIGLPSAGLSNPLKIDPNGASVGGVTAGASLFGAGAATASVTYYTKPVSLGKIWSTPPGPFSVYDLSMYLVRRVCQ